MSYYPQTIADKMKKGLSNEIRIICEIGRVLREDNLTPVEVSYYMNVDEDFIPDVMDCFQAMLNPSFLMGDLSLCQISHP